MLSYFYVLFALISAQALAQKPSDHFAATIRDTPPTQADPAPAARVRQENKQIATTQYVPGRWVDGAFQYKGAGDRWSAPSALRVAKDSDPHVFVNADGETVEYETGDVLFRVEGMGWFKADKNSPKTGDPMVPNPTGFALSATERAYVRATNVWRQQHGKPALVVDPILMKTARQRTVFSHTANGMMSWDQAARNGFTGPATDNLSSGDRTPEGSVQNLAADGPSEGHYKQLMGWKNSNGWRDFGMNRIGVATSGPGGTWIQIYGRQ